MKRIAQKAVLIKALAAGLAVSVISACTTVPSPTKPPIQKNNFDYAKSHLSWLIEKEMKRAHITGLSIALVSNGESVWQQGFGYADKAAKEPVTPSTRFRAASLAKFINALAIMDLQEKGLVDIDTPIDAYLLEFSLASRFDTTDITVRQLLSHQSGLPSDLIRGMWVKSPGHFSEALSFLENNAVPHAPDTMVSYSNVGFDVIGLIIEKVTNEKYETFINRFITQLGLSESKITSSPNDPPTAKGYVKKKASDELHLRDVPAAGLTSNAADLASLMSYLHQQVKASPLSQHSGLKQIFTDHASDKPLNLNRRVGLGIFYYDGILHRKYPVFGHGGAAVNHRAVIKFSPTQQIGVAVLSNSRNATSTLHRIANNAIALVYEATHGRPAPRVHAHWPRTSVEDILSADALVGHYATPVGKAEIYRRKDQLRVSIGGRTLRLYQRKPNGLFYLKYKFLGLFNVNIGFLGNLGIAMRKIEGRELLVGVSTVGNAQLIGKKIQPTTIPPAWQARAGNYRIVEPLEVIDLPNGGIKIRDGFLLAHAKTDRGDQMEVVLKPVSDDEAIVEGYGRGLGETVYVVKDNNGERLKYSNLLFEKIAR